MGTERPPALIKDDKQLYEELSFSLSLSRKGLSHLQLSLLELLGGAKSSHLQVAPGSGETGPLVKSQHAHLRASLSLPIPGALSAVYLTQGRFDSNFAC